jgi:hypothetical protein
MGKLCRDIFYQPTTVAAGISKSSQRLDPAVLCKPTAGQDRRRTAEKFTGGRNTLMTSKAILQCPNLPNKPAVYAGEELSQSRPAVYFGNS